MLALIGLVLAIGLADSINPSTVAPALFLATRGQTARTVLVFAAGAFAAYTLGGVLLVLGPGQAALAALPHPDHDTTHEIELGAGAALLAFAVVTWALRNHFSAALTRTNRRRRGHGWFFLGFVIMAFELPTAFPYFAVIAAVVGSGRDLLVQIALIVLFNVAFVAPLVAIAAARRAAGPRSERVLAVVRDQLDRHGAFIIPALMLVLALAALSIGLVGVIHDR